MIEFRVTGHSPDMLGLNAKMQEVVCDLACWHRDVLDEAFMAAVIKECGNKPRNRTIRKHAVRELLRDGTNILKWRNKEIAKVPPISIFRPGIPPQY